MFGPNVTVITGTHPISPRLREAKLQYDLPVRIGRNVWVGAGAIILPGVTIGDNAVISAGCVVTKDVEANAIVAGVPGRVIRMIDESDDVYFDHGRKIPDDIVERYLK